MNRQRLKNIHSKTNGHCWYCGVVLQPLGDWEIEHQTPKAKGGNDELFNLVPACRSCNMRKGCRTVEEYRHALIAKLEGKISEAYELSEELESYVGWPQGEPPINVTTISQAIDHAAKLALSTRLTFYGELDQFRECSNSNPPEEAELMV